MSVTEFIGGLPRLVRLALGVLMAVAIAVADYQIRRELSIGLFYLIPVSFITWFVGPWMGVFSAMVCAALSLVPPLSGAVEYHYPITPFWNAGLYLGIFLFATFILTQIRSLYDRERRLSRHDFLTGVLNERAFFELLATEKNRARRYNYPLTLAYLDLDNFKEVNDKFGHSEGNAVLIAVARSMAENVRDSDAVARLGGDEFGVLLPQTAPEAAWIVLEKLERVLTETMAASEWPVTFSIGAVTYAVPPDSTDEIIGKADQIMYSIKSSGKARLKQEVVGYGQQ
jgi:diguanylate cyclase (GGDEF)-like protein